MNYYDYDEYLDAQSSDNYEAYMDRRYDNVEEHLVQRQRVLLSKCNHRIITLSKEERDEFDAIGKEITRQMSEV